MRIIFLLLIFLCLFPALLAAREASDITGDRFEETAGRGLEIRTNPSGVTVYIDGVERAVTPVTLESLLPGEHFIKLSKEGYRDRLFTVTLFKTSRLVVSIEMEEERGLVQLSIYRASGSPQALPLDPQIYTSALDETETAVTLSSDNKALLSLQTGYRTIKARAFGWEDVSVTVLVNDINTVTADIYMTPAAFKLGNVSQGRKRFSPMNSGSLGVTEYRFEVSAPGYGTITITDRDGLTVYEKRLGNFNTWVQYVTWNGRDLDGKPLPEGIYTARIEALPLHELANASKAETFSLSMETEIDYSASIFPLSLQSGISGLTFAPMPQTLPAKSYQLEAHISYGYFRLPLAGAKEAVPFSGAPFDIGMRVAPINKLEIAAALNINPRLENKTGWGISGSAKYNILNGNGIPLYFAAAASYAWASENGEAPLSPGKGVGLYTPLSLELSNFSIVFTPSIFWRGPEGLVPALLLSAGALYRANLFTAGLSLRTEFDFTEKSEGLRFLAGAQASFFPPPSNFIFSILTGLWTQSSHIGAYGGLGIGLIY